MKKLITILIMVAAMNVSGQWAHLNFIEGGYVKTIMRDSSRFIYVATNNSYQIYRSANNGNSWRLFTNDFPYFQIQNMMSTKNAIFAATFGGGVLKSINHGLNWVQYNNGITTEYAMSFAMNDEYIFAGTQNGVYRSSNEGAVWEYVNSGIGFTHGVHAMVVQDSVIFAATSIGSPGYMYRTTNNGLNWTLINNGLPLFYATQLSKCGNRVFSIGGDEKLYATSNYGDNWNAVSLPQNSYVHTMTAKGDTLISSLSGIINKLYITTNGGVDWTLINSASQYYTNCITILSNRLISTNNYSIYRSTDFGNNWSAVNKGFTDVEILAVTAKDNNVIAGTNGHGVFKSTNYGISWNMVQSLDSHSTINNFTWQGNSLYTNYGTRIMRSTDFGSTFFQQGNTPPSITYSSPFAIKNDIFIGGFSSSGIYRSTNAGFNWTLSLSGLPTYIFSVPIIFFRDTTCFAFASEAPFEGNLFYSNNYGLTWDSVSNSGIWRSPSCVNYSTAHNKIYLGYSGVYVSTNSGFNWLPSNNGIPSNSSVSSFFINSDTIYSSLKSGGIYKSAIQSSIWTSFNEGLKNLHVNSIYGSGMYLYAGVNCNGIYRRGANIITTINNTSENIISYKLFQNYPNPFNPNTIIRFQIKDSRLVTLKVYDILGKEVATLVNEKQSPGVYEVTFDGSQFPSGIYFYKLETDSYRETKRMLMIK